MAKFWNGAIHPHEHRELPADVFERGYWLWWGDRYRPLVKPFDVARYNQDDFSW